jgi:hypothetical protein
VNPKEETIARLKEQIEDGGLVPDEAPADVPFPEVEDGEEDTLLEEEGAATEEVGEDAQDEEAAEQRSSTREYVLLENAGKDTWTIVGRAVSSSPENALRSLGEKKLKDGVQYVGVPTRSWQPAPASVKTTTTISFS